MLRFVMTGSTSLLRTIMSTLNFLMRSSKKFPGISSSVSFMTAYCWSFETLPFRECFAVVVSVAGLQNKFAWMESFAFALELLSMNACSTCNDWKTPFLFKNRRKAHSKSKKKDFRERNLCAKVQRFCGFKGGAKFSLVNSDRCSRHGVIGKLLWGEYFGGGKITKVEVNQRVHVRAFNPLLKQSRRIWKYTDIWILIPEIFLADILRRIFLTNWKLAISTGTFRVNQKWSFRVILWLSGH